MSDAMSAPRRPSPDGAGPYRITVRGEVAPHWEHELQMQLSYARTEAGIVTTLSGPLPDQAALLGVLGRLAMWGYQIVMVAYDGENAPPEARCEVDP